MAGFSLGPSIFLTGKGKSKHDIETNNKRNADRVMNFPPEFGTGDGDAIAMRLSNAVYNDLKVIADSRGEETSPLSY